MFLLYYESSTLAFGRTLVSCFCFGHSSAFHLTGVKQFLVISTIIRQSIALNAQQSLCIICALSITITRFLALYEHDTVTLQPKQMFSTEKLYRYSKDCKSFTSIHISSKNHEIISQTCYPRFPIIPNCISRLLTVLPQTI